MTSVKEDFFPPSDPKLLNNDYALLVLSKDGLTVLFPILVIQAIYNHSPINPSLEYGESPPISALYEFSNGAGRIQFIWVSSNEHKAKIVQAKIIPTSNHDSLKL